MFIYSEYIGRIQGRSPISSEKWNAILVDNVLYGSAWRETGVAEKIEQFQEADAEIAQLGLYLRYGFEKKKNCF